MNRFRLTILAVILMILALSCGKAESDKDTILDLLESIEKLVEDQYTASLLDLLSDDFQDMEERQKPEMEEVLNRYFEAYSGIVVNILGTQFDDLRSHEAQIQTDVSLSHGAAKMFRKIVAYSGQTYRFKIRLKKVNQKWKIFRAEWRYVYLEELFPESMKLLKKLFPKLR